MDRKFIAQRKEELLQNRRSILRHLAEGTEGIQAIVGTTEPKDAADLASDDVDKQNLEALGAVESRTLALIESALARIETNHYGVCLDCSRPIPQPRLEAVPYALFCVDCQAKRDRANR